jgi:hypothetical protein
MITIPNGTEPPPPRRPTPVAIVAGGVVLLIVFLGVRALFRHHDRPTLVVLVAGTFGNTTFWTNIVPGQATFASELQRAMGSGTDVVPFLWASSTAHADRLAAAQNLAKLIDQKSPAYGRVCLVSHSHGGNVALLAAGLATTPVDTVVCLSTPHLHLRTKAANGSAVNVPVYCTAATMAHVRRIVSVWPDTDQVPDGWANWQTGITDNEAVGMTTDARAALGNPRLADDGDPITNLVLGGPQRVFAETALENVPAARQAVIQSDVPDGLGAGAHSAIHSRRMGYVIGQLLAQGSSDAAVADLATLVQPATADDGSPAPQPTTPPDDHPPAGWRLAHAAVHLVPEAKAAANNWDGSDPMSYLMATPTGTGDPTPLTTAGNAITGYAPEWSPRWICTPGHTYLLSLMARHGLLGDTDLGDQSLPIPPAGPPPSQCVAAVDRRVYWSANLQWEAVHY